MLQFLHDVMDALFSMMTMDHGQQAMLPSLVFKALVRFDEGLIEMVMRQCSGKKFHCRAGTCTLLVRFF